jgi:hypothetical protein
VTSRIKEMDSRFLGNGRKRKIHPHPPFSKEGMKRLIEDDGG